MNDKANILYLEDDLNLGEITSDILTRKGFTVKWAVDGKEGIQMLENHTFDIIVADIMMPKLDGYTFLKILRENENKIPLILLSARVLTEDVLKGFSLGADDYIRKPFSIEELIARICRLLKNSVPLVHETKRTILIGDYQYNPHNYQLIYKEKVFTLSPRSGEILYRLASRQDGILPRKQTLIELWGDDSFFNGRSLDVFISKLRKQLANDPKINIVNIRAVGYRLIISE